MFSYARHERNFLNRGCVGYGPCWLVFCIVLGFPSPTHGARFRVLGASTFSQLRVQENESGGLVVTGTLRDERDQPVTSAVIEIDRPGAKPCEPDSSVTNLDGEFCFDLPGASAIAGPESVVSFRGNSYFGPARRTAPLFSAPVGLGLELKLDEARWSLSKPSHRASARLTSPAPGSDRFKVQLWLDRGDAPLILLQAEPLSSNHEAVFDISSEHLGNSGSAQVLATIDQGSSRLAEARETVVLVSEVLLEWASELEHVRPDDGFDTVLAVRSAQGPVDGGWVETHVGESVVGLARVENGVATVVSRFSAPRRKSVVLSARYVTDSPFFASANSLSKSVEIMPPSAWKHVPWLVLIIVIGSWVVRTWHRPRSRALPRPASGVEGPVVASARLVAEGPAATGWLGTVRDAHTGEFLSGVQLELSAPAVDERNSVIATARTNGDGVFKLVPASEVLPEGTRMSIAAPWHSTLRLPAPKPGTIEIALVARRRTLLLNLIRWAEQSGAPFAHGLLTTPDRVARRASEKGLTETETWARGIEQAAFGRLPPDAQDEGRLLALTPPLASSRPRPRE